MDWVRAIERNSEALKGIVAALFAMLELAGGASVARLPRSVHSAVLRVLRPAESAMRRLIVIAARGLVAKLPASRPLPAGRVIIGKSQARRPPFQLFDPRKRFAAPRRGSIARALPRIHVFASDPRVAALWRTPEPPAAPARPPDDGVSAERLCRRLAALKLALEDLPRQARRLARWQARREKAANPKFREPLRPGRPPGHHKIPVHEVDHVLGECHALARDAMEPDTS